ncbi:porin [Paraferrimonas haliotis]|uniref:Porin n=1 Tax=Paraferrimonas haliotis TaxID=2013866 RepID=A0AA37TR79_9GAMM|nr:porin [Paraferrimonas haliotis]GLS84098.1 porin [Paraferrimonas haliotis]
MKKSVIATAVLMIMGTGSALAADSSADFYGTVRVALSNSDTGYASNSGGGAGLTLEDDNSLIGVKGNIDINAPVDLIYKVEVGVQGMDNSKTNTPFNARDTWIGVKSDFGTVTFGRQSLAMWKSEGGVDQFNLTNADMNRLFTGNNRIADTIGYTSPKIGDLTVFATYQLKDDVYGKDAKVEGDLYSVAAVYGDKSLKNKIYNFGVGYNAGVNNEEAYRATAQVKLAGFKIGGVYQHSKDLVNTNLEGDGFMVDVAYPLTDALTLKARYGQDESARGVYMKRIIGDGNNGITAADVTDTKVVNYAVGADYALSKATKVYAHYSRYDASVDTTTATKLYDQAENVINLGLMTRF